MTTILGIKAGEEGIVIASDTLTTLTYSSKNGKPTEDRKYEFKIVAGDSFSIAQAGTDNKYVQAFLNYLRDKKEFSTFFRAVRGDQEELESSAYMLSASASKQMRRYLTELTTKRKQPESQLETLITTILSEEPKSGTEPETILKILLKSALEKLSVQRSPIEEAAKGGYLMEADLLNRYLFSRGEDSDDYAEFILASNKPKLILRRIDRYGNLRAPPDDNSPPYIVVGTGSERVNKFIDDEEYKGTLDINPTELTLTGAYELAKAALENAMGDPHTGGIIDFAVVTKDKVRHYGPEKKALLDKTNEDYDATIKADLISKK